MIEGFVFEKRLLKQVEAPGFIKNDFVPDYTLDHLVGSIVLAPTHGTMKSPLHGTESRNDAVFEVLDVRKHLVLFHGQSKDYVRETLAGIFTGFRTVRDVGAHPSIRIDWRIHKPAHRFDSLSPPDGDGGGTRAHGFGGRLSPRPGFSSLPRRLSRHRGTFPPLKWRGMFSYAEITPPVPPSRERSARDSRRHRKLWRGKSRP